MKLHYLLPEEEAIIKRGVPWENIDVGIRDLVRSINEIPGIATVQSCQGHVRPIKDEEFHIDSAMLCVRATEEITHKILFDLAPECGILDVGLRYFSSDFWISISVDPGERRKLFELSEELAGCEFGG